VRKTASSRTEFLEQVLRAEVFEVGEGLVGLVAQTDKGILIAEAESDPRVIRHEDPALRVRSVIVVPISFRGSNLAVLAIVNRSDGLPFDESDFSLASSLAEQAALAVQNLALMDLQIERNRLEADLSLASNIQGLLLPSTFPSIPGVSLAALYEPAQKVGGDLYDLIPIDPHRYGVAVADVAGKGIPASLIMAITQSNLSHFARRSESPLATVEALNDVLHHETRHEMFVTLVYAVIDLRAETVTVVRAGHEAPLLWKASAGEGRIEALKPRGMALGMMGEAVFRRSLQASTHPFTPGDVLLLFTDGIIEATNASGEEFGNTRLAQALAAHHRGPPEEINRCIREAVGRWTAGESALDDITLLCIKRTP
jgi:phosphoserine phosphatase RsbU/P